MSQPLPLTELDEEARQQALARYQLLEPFLNGQTSLTAIAETYKLTLRTLQRWVRRYRQWGVAGLTRKKRSDAGQRRIPIELQQLIESLALQKSRPSAAAIHRQLIPVANENRWSIPSYDTVYETVRAIAGTGNNGATNAHLIRTRLMRKAIKIVEEQIFELIWPVFNIRVTYCHFPGFLRRCKAL